ncbi:MAG: helix-turn-helix domain-containing protein [Oscillospiraceae bacterium]|jgi:excisionase family DNA binding protein|nr:helix-turn-helix domain-containing protein [Oscillospiraceae bacterium]
MKQSPYKNYDELPLMLSVPQVASVLGISRAGAYELARSESFPSLTVGSRIIVPKDEFIAWVKHQTVGNTE